MKEIKELKKLSKKIRNLHGIENLESIMGFGIGETLSKMNQLIDEIPSYESFLIDMAEQQLLGFSHGKWNRTDIEGLVESMNLSKKEWKILKSKYALSYLDEDDVLEIENYFKKDSGE